MFIMDGQNALIQTPDTLEFVQMHFPSGLATLKGPVNDVVIYRYIVGKQLGVLSMDRMHCCKHQIHTIMCLNKL